MTQPANKRLVTEAALAVEAAARSAADATKVNSSTYTAGLATKQDTASLGSTVAADATVRAAFGRPTSTDGTGGLPAPTGIGLEFVITATGLQDIRFNGVSL